MPAKYKIRSSVFNWILPPAAWPQAHRRGLTDYISESPVRGGVVDVEAEGCDDFIGEECYLFGTLVSRSSGLSLSSTVGYVSTRANRS